LFFPSSGPAVGLLASFATYFLGFAVRPVGSVFFGILGDKVGRKFVLLSTVPFMALVWHWYALGSTLIGVCRRLVSRPAVRSVRGTSWGFRADDRIRPARDSRGFLASLPFAGITLSTVAAALVYFLVLARIENVDETWRWRVALPVP
jgi:MHS family metabolite:H+ symporter-like MFS transporter